MEKLMLTAALPTFQVMLFDEQRKLLESKFLKRDVVIRSGESIPLDAHLVDIGECNGNNLEGNDSKTDGKMGIRHERKNQLENGGAFGKDDKTCEVQTFGTGLSTARTIKSSMKEWQVMYTTQVTQKAKKYHDGFLQLTNSGSLQRQIMLYDGSKKLINSRFLKKDEVIQSGETIAFDAHLVDIGEPEGNYQGLMDSDVHISNHNVAGKSVLMNRVPNSLKTNKSFLKGKPQKIACSRGFADSSFSIPDINETKLSNNISANKPLDDGKPQKMACSRGYADPSFSISNINEIKFSEGISANKPFRDAIQIMSILQKPMKQDSFASGSIDKKITNPAPFTKEPQNSDSSRNIAESKSCCSGDEPLNNIEVGDSHQPLSDNVEAYTQETDDVTKNSVELKISTETASVCRENVKVKGLERHADADAGSLFTSRNWTNSSTHPHNFIQNHPPPNPNPNPNHATNNHNLLPTTDFDRKRKLGEGKAQDIMGEVSKTHKAIQSLDKAISNLEMELAVARMTQGHGGATLLENASTNKTLQKAFVVIGINTAFSSRKRRDSLRKTWMPTGEKLKKMEKEKGIVIRFVIGHSATKGGVLDKAIEKEEAEYNDFLRLKHVEGYHQLSTKTRLYFSTAASIWDADFYVKVDDDVHLNLGMLASTLAKHRSKPRVYIGCMKSGPVLSQKGVKYHEPEYWKFGEEGNKYFRHATGQIYAISKDLAAFISINSNILHRYANEDVSLGSWLIGLEVEHVDERSMCCGTPPDCEWKSQAGNVCVASFDWSCSGVCNSVERMKVVHSSCGEGDAAVWNWKLDL
ncbi:Glycosyl transferase, family 31 [Corchorus olitorius]|uniref:Glycosyl transferase, family 31 n=1 Tax=Corchorus olitorius TaxID=93759 RepID=A0A1R3I4U3_9ROSI|nr:Glycosyl transferase, family 31 [Corchorus olitorius]